MQPSKVPETGALIANAFCDAVTAALTEASPLEWQVSVGEASLAQHPDLSAAAGFRFSFSGVSAGDVLVGVPHEMLPRLALRGLNDDPPDGTNLQKSRLLSALEGKVSQLENALSRAAPVTLQVKMEDGPVLADKQVFELVCSPGSGGNDSNLSMYVCVSPKLAAELEPAMAKAFVFPQPVAVSSANFDLVMDVELNVTLRFGQRQLALREVLELASGSVVELDRQVDEPIELILDGKVVARGEAVIIDGNYGMRVTEVLQPLMS